MLPPRSFQHPAPASAGLRWHPSGCSSTSRDQWHSRVPAAALGTRPCCVPGTCGIGERRAGSPGARDRQGEGRWALGLLPELHPSCEAYSSPVRQRFPMQSCSVPEHWHHSHASQDGHTSDKKLPSRSQTSQGYHSSGYQRPLYPMQTLRHGGAVRGADTACTSIRVPILCEGSQGCGCPGAPGAGGTTPAPRVSQPQRLIRALGAVDAAIRGGPRDWGGCPRTGGEG